MVVMAVEFSGILGENTHDLNFLKPLVEDALGIFPLEYLLADKAYLTAKIPQWLADQSSPIKAVIPIKKNHFKEEKGTYGEALTELIEWFNKDENRDFHELYRLRPKIEGLFSLLKRLTGTYCWSRGRKRKATNAKAPCIAWINEMLCRFIYLNLRATVTLEEETGVRIDYLVASRYFPAPDEPLIKSRRVA